MRAFGFDARVVGLRDALGSATRASSASWKMRYASFVRFVIDALRVLRPLRMAELVEHRAIEGGDVVRLAAGDESLVDDAFSVEPLCAGVLQIGLERRPRGQL